MAEYKIFQLEKNEEDIRRIVLKNIVKMITERGYLNKEDYKKNKSNLINQNNDDLYTIGLNNNTGLTVKIFNQKITGISKQSNINEFLHKNKDVNRIIIVKSITTKAVQYIKSTYPSTEVFLENELLINLVDNILVPRYEVLERNSENYKTFFEQYQSKKRQMPRVHVTDPLARYYNLKKGDIVRIIRPSETSAVSIGYRIAI